MPDRNRWTRQQLLIAFKLYCEIPFGKFHQSNPTIIQYGKIIGRNPSALAMKLSNIASLDPAITATGRKGLTKASNSDKLMWEEMTSDWSLFLVEIQKAEKELKIQSALNNETDNDFVDNGNVIYLGSNKIIQSTQRIGQHFFRKSVLSAYDNKCCISGLSIPSMLVASHIIPWRIDEKNRLNPSNGLCLSSLHDKAFDLGIITVNENMKVMVSRSKVGKDDHFFDSAIMAFDGASIKGPEKFFPHKEFLSYHRQNIFKP
ncbi:MAG: HNH endonuclease [Candidatus Nitrohelix vancouverensis]|uniref:HNH endonuclease n=1 Tax=Candidatus Nitrohelix vancouverensis TaxID=2705534 RepID=A0A7T0G2P8_9BACT|nr:MAG: HNH endonuclease [Candidatus Nitrohelix vancouverensis]